MNREILHKRIVSFLEWASCCPPSGIKITGASQEEIEAALAELEDDGAIPVWTQLS